MHLARRLVPLLALPFLLAGCPDPATQAPGEPPQLVEAEGLLLEGRRTEAAAALESIAPETTVGDEARLRWATAWMHARRPDRAAEVLAPVLAAPPSGSGAGRLLRAEALIRSGAFGEAESDLGELERAGVGGERRHVLMALLHAARGHRREVEDELRPLIEAGTRDADAWVQWAQIAPNPYAVQERLLEGVARAADPFSVRRALGRHLLVTGDASRAIPHLEEAVRLRPWHRDARLEWINALHLSGREADLVRARDEAARLWDQSPEDGDARLALAQALAALGQPAIPGSLPEAREMELLEQAAAHFDALLSIPGGPPARRIALLHGRARIHILLIPTQPDTRVAGGHLERALALLAEAERLDPGAHLTGSDGLKVAAETKYLEGRAWRRARFRDDQRATAAYEEAIAIDPRHADAMWDLAVIYYDWMRTAEYQRRARRLFDEVARLRNVRGLPPIEDPARRAIVEHNRRLAEAGEDFPPGEATPGLGR